MKVRFAPSPTGALHIGGARTALFNWLLARHHRGQLLLRIEDTDRERSTPQNVAQIIDALQWLGLDWDEGPVMQSERSARHGEALQAMLDSGRAYYSGANAEDVKEYKRRHGAEQGFRGEPQAGGAVRLRVPAEGATVVHDLIRGDTRFEHAHLDDPVIARADGSVLYNFAVAIDDLDACISHVVRGEDHLSNTPKQLLVLEAAKAAGLGGEAPLPSYARLPRAVAISQEKIRTLADFWPLTGALLDGANDDPKARRRWLGEPGRATLADVREALARAERFDEDAVGAALQAVVERRGVKPGEVYQPLRVAISGTTVSPGIFESVALLGREETLRRIDAALASG